MGTWSGGKKRNVGVCTGRAVPLDDEIEWVPFVEQSFIEDSSQSSGSR
jgi:hypothetical protein